MLQRGGEPEADGKPRSHHSYRAPELLGVEPLHSGLWRQAQALPWLLHRMEGLLHALPLADVKALPADMVLAQVLCPRVSLKTVLLLRKTQGSLKTYLI